MNYSYDSYGRFYSLTNGADNFSYSYLANSELLSTTTLPNGITSTKTYESKRNLLSSIENKHNSDTVSKFEYANDAIGRRTSVAKSGTAFSAADTIDYGYNSRSELLSAVAKNDTAYNYAYGFDNIGNRISSSESGSALGYTSNFLNQYIGITGRNGISYDLDGNMLTDGSGWTFTWDAENRLSSAVKGTQRLEFKYDYASRRIEKKVFNGETLSVHKKYLYDGWNLIAEYDALNATNARSYVWGLDLTQTLQGAGGVGGLLSVKDSSGTYYPCYDGNGNVTQYLDNNGLKVASYDYNPFGRVSSKAGTKADDMPFQFSTKYLDTETELSYYGYRYYSPELGRWINRDPIGENGGWNIYGVIGNDCINFLDILGLKNTANCDKLIEERKKLAKQIGKAMKDLDSFAKNSGLSEDTNPLDIADKALTGADIAITGTAAVIPSGSSPGIQLGYQSVTTASRPGFQSATQALGTASKTIAVAGIVVNGASTVKDISEGNTGSAISNGSSIAGGVLSMACPPAAVPVLLGEVGKASIDIGSDWYANRENESNNKDVYNKYKDRLNHQKEKAKELAERYNKCCR